MFDYDLENELFGIDEAEEDNREEEADKENDDDDAKKDGEEGQKKRVRVVPKKPVPKLDTVRLCGPEGIPNLPKKFEKFPWRSKGHEAEEMDAVLQRVELWAHRLFPKMALDDFLGRVEKLGSKREVQTTLRRMRMGTMSTDDAPVTDDVSRGDGRDEFDDVMREYQDSTQVARSPSPVHQPPVQSSLTDEQRARIEQNRLLALERKRQRELAANQPSTSVP